MTEKEFNHIILPLANNIYAYARQIIADSADAADITQEVMIKLWERRKELKDIDNPKAWGLKITRNLCLDWLKKKKPTYDAEQILRHCESEADPLQKIANEDMAALLRRIINTLPANQREVLILREIEELEFEEIEQVTGLTANHIRVLLSRGRMQVRKMAEELRIREGHGERSRRNK